MAGRSAFLFASVILTAMLFMTADSHAAKVVPTIRIEIPSEKQGPETESPSVVPDEAISNEPSFLDSPEDDSETGDDPQPELPSAENTPRKPVMVFYGDKELPEPVRATRRLLLEAAQSGEVDRLKPIFDKFTELPIIGFGGDEDPIDALKESSGDGEGVEVLAILIEILESGYVHREKGEDGEIFVWPYFVETPLEDLDKKQLVELFHIITAGDFADMKDYGAYIFYRVGITPDGELKYFIAGD